MVQLVGSLADTGTAPFVSIDVTCCRRAEGRAEEALAEDRGVGMGNMGLGGYLWPPAALRVIIRQTCPARATRTVEARE